MRLYTLFIPFLLATTPSIEGNGSFLNIDKYRADVLKMVSNMPFDLPFEMGTKVDNIVVKDSEIFYYLFNKTHPTSNYSIDTETMAGIDRKLKVKILVHGWTEHCFVEWCKALTKAYVKMGNFNIIVVDWSTHGDADYMTASLAVPPVGDKMGDFIVKLHEKLKIPLKNFHLISHSLGCHVASFMGKRVFKVTGRKVGRITALDPAAPIFAVPGVSEDKRINKDDATFVDIVHTDGGVLGFTEPVGTVDFYPNGGTAVQPGCSLLRPDVQYEDLFCSHARSHRYYLRSIYDNKITAIPCAAWSKFTNGACKGNKTTRFGEWTSTKISGNYYFNLEVPTVANYD